MNKAPSLALIVLPATFFLCTLAYGQTSPPPPPVAEQSATESRQPSQENAAKPVSTQTSSDAAKSPERQKDTTQTRDKSDKGDANDLSDPPKHHSHVHLGSISIGAGYARYPVGLPPYYGYGPYFPAAFGFGGFYSPFAYGFYDPFYGPYYAGFYPGGLGYAPDKGEVRLGNAAKGAQVYLNGGFAGPADKLKSMWLDPGAYDLSVSVAGGPKFEQRIYVITGKTLKIRAQVKSE